MHDFIQTLITHIRYSNKFLNSPDDGRTISKNVCVIKQFYLRHVMIYKHIQFIVVTYTKYKSKNALQ